MASEFRTKNPKIHFLPYRKPTLFKNYGMLWMDFLGRMQHILGQDPRLTSLD